MTDYASEERSVPGLMAALTRNLSALVRQELALARAETAETLAGANAAVTTLAAGAVVTAAGFVYLLYALVLALALTMPLWLSALLVGAVVTAVGGGLVQKGRRDLRRNGLAPRRTIASMRRDVRLARETRR